MSALMAVLGLTGDLWPRLALLLGVGLAVAVICGGCYLQGRHDGAASATETLDAERLARAHADARSIELAGRQREQVAAADAQASTESAAQAAAVATQTEHLHARLAHVALLAPVASRAAAGGLATGCAPGGPLHPDNPPPQAAPDLADGVVPSTGSGWAGAAMGSDPGAQLSLGAVRLWNDALRLPSGAAASLAAGAAGADARAGRAGGAVGQLAELIVGADQVEADTAASGVTLDQAWRNHIDNAASCAVDRAQLHELIAAVRARQAAALITTP